MTKTRSPARPAGAPPPRVREPFAVEDDRGRAVELLHPPAHPVQWLSADFGTSSAYETEPIITLSVKGCRPSRATASAGMTRVWGALERPVRLPSRPGRICPRL